MRKAHPIADLFPLLGEAELAILADDIFENGLREAITLHPDGSILDGRNRDLACLRARVEPRYVEWDGQGTAEAFVVSMNLHRRHLKEGQRAMIGGRLPTLNRGDVATQKDETTDLETEKDGQRIRRPLFSSKEAADLMNIGETALREAKTILKEGTPEEIASVDSAQTSVSATAKRVRKRRTKKPAKAKLAHAGNNPERIQKRKINAEIWGHLREALTNLTSLPLAADVARIVRGQEKRTGLVDARLTQSLNWLKEFENEWNERRPDAA